MSRTNHRERKRELYSYAINKFIHESIRLDRYKEAQETTMPAVNVDLFKRVHYSMLFSRWNVVEVRQTIFSQVREWRVKNDNI